MASDSRRQSHHRIESSSRNPSTSQQPVATPSFLSGRSFLLEIDNKHDRDRVSVLVRKCGGQIQHTYEDSDPYIVVSDHSLAIKVEQKKIDLLNPSEKLLKSVPSLLREALKRKIKIRTVETFMRHLNQSINNARKTSSATYSTGTHKVRQSLQIRKIVHEKPVITKKEEANKRRRSSIITIGNSFLRFDIPGKQPDIRPIYDTTFFTIHSGMDAGFSVFRKAEPTLATRRAREYTLFLVGQFTAAKKTNYKLEDDETYCQICSTTVPKMIEHIKSDAHRSRMKHYGFLSDMERVFMSTRIALDKINRIEKRKSVEVSRKQIEPVKLAKYMYGENEFKIEWDQIRKTLNKNEEVVISEKENSKPTPYRKIPAHFPSDVKSIALLEFTGYLPTRQNP